MKKVESHTFGSSRPYILGFVLSLILTVGSYFLVSEHVFSNAVLVPVLISLALIQLGVQLFCFLHLGQEKKPRWNLIFFVTTVGIIFIVVVGSIWIMHHLNYNMTPRGMDSYIMQDEGVVTPAPERLYGH